MTRRGMETPRGMTAAVRWREPQLEMEASRGMAAERGGGTATQWTRAGWGDEHEVKRFDLFFRFRTNGRPSVSIIDARKNWAWSCYTLIPNLTGPKQVWPETDPKEQTSPIFCAVATKAPANCSTTTRLRFRYQITSNSATARQCGVRC
jgi:hypothetical protein